MSLFHLIPSLIQPARTCTTPRNSEQHPTTRPQFEINETPEAWALSVYMPGVSKENLEFSIEETQVRIAGKRTAKQNPEWNSLYRETSDTDFELVLSHDNAVDTEKIHAEMKDGVLRASLPKAAAIKPRRIAVN